MSKAIRIAIVTGVDKATTLQSKGGTEVWAAGFVLEAARRGHEVDLYAAHGSLTGERINLIELTDRVLPEYYSEEYFTQTPSMFLFHKERFLAGVYTSALRKVIEKIDDYDVIVDSVFHPSFSLNAQLLGKPVIAIGHFPADVNLSFYVHNFGWPHNSHMVFPSRYQYDMATFLKPEHRSVIPHGIDPTAPRFSEYGGEDILWMGRIHSSHADKGVEEAMRIGHSLKRKMYVTGVVEPLPEERAYFDTRVRPLASAEVRLEEQRLDTPTDKDTIFGSAKALLLPLHWEEPFGLVMLESMARGTPVIAYARGSVPELIEDGVTGFVVNASSSDVRGNFKVQTTGQEGLCDAIRLLDAMSEGEYAGMRKACRARVENLFTTSRMFDQYESLFARLLSGTTV